MLNLPKHPKMDDIDLHGPMRRARLSQCMGRGWPCSMDYILTKWIYEIRYDIALGEGDLEGVGVYSN